MPDHDDDEWHRGGHAVDDWDFGLTDRQRGPKPALSAAKEAFQEIPFATDRQWPRVSVIVCSHNGARTLDECLTYLERLHYPDYEIIVVHDGSTDATAAIAGRHRVRVISTTNAGLSAARNAGLGAAIGEFVAYIDDDAFPDRDWLTHLAAAFEGTDFAGVGGPKSVAAALQAGRHLRRTLAGRSHACAALRPNCRTYPRLQYGLPPRASGCDWRIRCAISRGGRRRGCLLAAPATGMAARLLAGCRCLAPSPQ